MASIETSVAIRACPSCGQTQGISRGRKNEFDLVSCAGCATLYTTTLTSRGAPRDYDSYYTAEHLTVATAVDQWLDRIVTTFEGFRHSNRLLDVGCGAGALLEAARRHRWQAFGVEVSRVASDHVRGRGIEVFCGALEQAGYPDDHFDVVIASEVLEHVPDPRGMLDEIARVLRPGGLLWATTPHGRGISARLLGLEWSNVMPPDHLQLFSEAAIRGLLRDAGFRHVEVVTHGTNPFEILHSLRRRPSPGPIFGRAESSYQLNRFLSESVFRRALKRALNGILNMSRMGDSLKVRAER